MFKRIETSMPFNYLIKELLANGIVGTSTDSKVYPCCLIWEILEFGMVGQSTDRKAKEKEEEKPFNVHLAYLCACIFVCVISFHS